ncbi:Hsp20/alpha crystallin family protein [Oceanobacillus saliphilus]|uniref:Hsp20/alpha crystallin family protein n=1 Tax=Oceanobacillus saliphilus TaxID=2925834 RepID=UPI00201DED96|nr:Hsp20/alpha crystallin family protein [Oceanobacillus saliphilus]
MRKDFGSLFSDLPYSIKGILQSDGIRIDIHETENEVVAFCDLPGLQKKDDLEIDVQNNILTISGSINVTNEVKGDNIHRRERFAGDFQRAVLLPSPVSSEGVSAFYKNGVLEVKMAKVPHDKKKIDIAFD